MSEPAPPSPEMPGLPWSRVALAALVGWPGLILARLGISPEANAHLEPLEFARSLGTVLAFVAISGALPFATLALLSRARWASPTGIRWAVRAATVATALVWGLITYLFAVREFAAPYLVMWAPPVIIGVALLAYGLGAVWAWLD